MSETDMSSNAGSEVPLEHAKELGEALAHIDVMRAAHEGLATGLTGVQATLNDIGNRVDTLAATQAETLERLSKLEPVAAAETEGEGAADTLEGTHSPGETANEAEKTDTGPIAAFHRFMG